MEVVVGFHANPAARLQHAPSQAGEGAIYALLEQASELLGRPELPRDGYYAFVCEKCAPTFDYYGWFAEAAALKEEAERLYAGN